MRLSARVNPPERDVGAQLSAQQPNQPQAQRWTIRDVVREADAIVVNTDLAAAVGMASARDRQLMSAVGAKRMFECVREELVQEQATRNGLFDRELERLHVEVETDRAGC